MFFCDGEQSCSDDDPMYDCVLSSYTIYYDDYYYDESNYIVSHYDDSRSLRYDACDDALENLFYDAFAICELNSAMNSPMNYRA